MHAIIRKTRHVLVWALPLALGACLAAPDLPPRKGAVHGDAPGLLPTSQIIARTADGSNTARLQAAPDARVASLRARATALRGPVIPADQRRRMLGAVARLR